MGKRTIELWCLFLLCTCLPACTLLVNDAIAKRPRHEASEDDSDAGDDAGADGGTSDGSTRADANGGTNRDGSAPVDEDTGSGEDGGPEPDSGVAGGKICIGYKYACGIDSAG